ncbi:hypothetical protein GCM10010208_55430 [Actinomadura livida]|nr:hypothetical protein GCM10010208_55430 [Actinomadura livida]
MEGTRSRNAVSSACDTTVPVGLFGLHTKTSRVRSVTASAIAARSCRSSRSGTWTFAMPARDTSSGYASNDRQAYMISAPGSATACSSIWMTPTAPAPTTTLSSGTRRRPASASTSGTAWLSG